MHRRNFARVSGVIVDECRTHGTFFDAGELEDVLHFVRSGGMALAGEHEAAERERNRRHLAVSPTPRATAADPSWALEGTDEIDLVSAFVRWASRWLGGRG
jgi:Zn-finger nucleic acid-binding protein